MGALAEVAAPVCRSACLQVFGIAGLEFVCVFGHDGVPFEHTNGFLPLRSKESISDLGSKNVWVVVPDAGALVNRCAKEFRQQQTEPICEETVTHASTIGPTPCSDRPVLRSRHTNWLPSLFPEGR